jgi:hypothetical protein
MQQRRHAQVHDGRVHAGCLRVEEQCHDETDPCMTDQVVATCAFMLRVWHMPTAHIYMSMHMYMHVTAWHPRRRGACSDAEAVF